VAGLIQHNRKVTWYLIVLLIIVILMNLITVGIIPLGDTAILIFAIILIIWIGVGLFYLLWWVRVTFRKVEIDKES